VIFRTATSIPDVGAYCRQWEQRRAQARAAADAALAAKTADEARARRARAWAIDLELAAADRATARRKAPMRRWLARRSHWPAEIGR
jgi:hypothetical protein